MIESFIKSSIKECKIGYGSFSNGHRSISGAFYLNIWYMAKIIDLSISYWL